MIEVVFSEDARYTMNLAKKEKLDSKIGEAILFIGPHLDIGNISVNIDELERYQSLNQLLNNPKQSQIELEHMSNTQRIEIEKLIEAAKKGEPIRIWKSDAPFSACGFAFVCHQLKSISSDMSVVPLGNTLLKEQDTLISYSRWGEVAPDEYDSFLKGEVTLSEIEKKQQAALWEQLKAENSPLRAVVNGQLLSVPEDFYDHLLVENFSDEEFTVDERLVEVLGEYSLGVSDEWYLSRINQLIKENKLTVTSSVNIEKS